MKKHSLIIHPVISPKIKWPAIVAPFLIIILAASASYEQWTTAQNITVSGFAVVLPLVIYLLLRSAQIQLTEKTTLHINKNKLEFKKEDEEKSIELNELQKVGIYSKMGFATEIRLTKKNDEVQSISLGGIIKNDQLLDFKEILKTNNIEISRQE